MDFKGWIRNSSDEHQYFSDGSIFIIAVKLSTGKYDIDIVYVECDEDYFGMFYRDTGDFYDAWEWDDVEYFILLEGEMPTKEPC